MSKFGKDLIESMREAAEHAEGTRKSSDLGTSLRERRRTTTSPREMMFRRREQPTHLPRPTEGRMASAPPSRSHPRLRVHVVAVLNVRAIRYKLHMSQSEFAAKYRIPLPTLKNWEQGLPSGNRQTTQRNQRSPRKR
jgi:hypothetical protein